MHRKMLKRAALTVALGACLGVMAPSVMAQSANGAIAGRANSGDQITVVNKATGLTRTVTVGADGSYRLSQLPVGDYSLQVKRDGEVDKEPVAVNVSLGGTTNVNLGGGAGNAVTLDSVQVTGSKIVNRVDVYSTESSFNIKREELARMDRKRERIDRRHLAEALGDIAELHQRLRRRVVPGLEVATDAARGGAPRRCVGRRVHRPLLTRVQRRLTTRCVFWS